MKKLGFLMLAMALLLGGTALAQNVGDNSVYFVTYFANNVSGAPDAIARFINDGDTGAGPAPNGNLWAAIYMFDDSQELTQCCACLVTADGVTSEDVKTELTNHPLSHIQASRGVIKVISSASPDPTAPKPTAGLRAWATHIQGTKPYTGPYVQTETAFADSNLGAAELTSLGLLCYYDLNFFSGIPCSCTTEDYDF